jgi:hypothetical protein
MSNLSLSDIIFLAKQSDNVIIANWLKDLEELINKTPNDFDLGEKIRKI